VAVSDSNVPTGANSQLLRLLSIVVGFLLVLLAVAGMKSYRDLAAARQRRGELESKIELKRDQNAALSRRIQLLQSDPATLERLAREEYRMVLPEDVVIVLPDEVEPPAEPGAEDARTP
jgi:cell division protein FtsB